MAAIAARLESMETLKEDVAALKSHVEIRGKSYNDNHRESSWRLQHQHHSPFRKIDFLAYAGGDPRGWILKAEKYFRYYQIPDAEKVDVASMHLESDALDLFSRLSADQTITLWEELVLAFQINFGPAEFQNPDEYLCSIKQTRSVQEYRQEFAMRSARHLAIDINTTPVIPNQLQPLIDKYQGIFHEPTTLPLFRSTSHSIPLLPNSTPPNIQPYRYPHSQKTEIEKQVDELLTVGFIQPSTSPFSSPVLLVKKKDNTWRMCVDYRALNKITVADKYPIPNIDELFDELYGTTVFSKFDLRSGHDMEHHMNHLEQALALLHDHRFYAKLSKCCFGQPQVVFLGHVITAARVHVEQEKISAIQSWHVPNFCEERLWFFGAYGRITTTEQQQLLLKLMPYDFSITHRAGKENKGADALSRRPHSCDLFALSVPYCLEVAVSKMAYKMITTQPT
ncbi:ty3-gypsy retrotransposon protein [Tanacetum coccineum]